MRSRRLRNAYAVSRFSMASVPLTVSAPRRYSRESVVVDRVVDLVEEDLIGKKTVPSISGRAGHSRVR
jgi:hypothetical protein